jgi:hypothetical protein
MGGCLFHHNDTIFHCTSSGNPGAYDIEVVSIHMTKAIAEAFARSHYEAAERILLSE